MGTPAQRAPWGGPVTIGIDDTDGPTGGCTTYALTEIVRVAGSLGVDLIGEPHLVRLNPNVPWKTRGNAALSARFGRGRGTSKSMGRLSGRPVRAFPRGAPLPAALLDRFLETAWAAVLSASDPGPRSDPAMVAFGPRPDPAFYYRAVRSVVRIPEARAELRRWGGRAWTRGSARGLVGATAAAAWPGRRVTWEVIGYRHPDRLGTRREVDPGSVQAAEGRFPGLFQCYDPATRRLLVAPHTPCPILIGLRSTDPTELPGPSDRSDRSRSTGGWSSGRTRGPATTSWSGVSQDSNRTGPDRSGGRSRRTRRSSEAGTSGSRSPTPPAAGGPAGRSSRRSPSHGSPRASGRAIGWSYGGVGGTTPPSGSKGSGS